MHIHRSAVDLVIQAPAKLNLFFEVLARRSDGYMRLKRSCVRSLIRHLVLSGGTNERASGITDASRFYGWRAWI